MNGTSLYTERLIPGVVGWFSTLAGSALLGVIALAIGPTVALIVTAAAVVVAALMVWALSPQIRVINGELIAGSAHIPITLLGPVEALSADDVTKALGPGSDARTYFCLRAACSTAVRLEVLDPRDPTPAWIVSTRHPATLAAAIERARAEAVAA